jgi:hypothetical protein
MANYRKTTKKDVVKTWDYDNIGHVDLHQDTARDKRILRTKHFGRGSEQNNRGWTTRTEFKEILTLAFRRGKK